MLRHLNEKATGPTRAVVLGANGFVGSAVAGRLEHDGIETVRITPSEVDLLSPGAANEVGALLRPGDALVAVAAIAPVRNPEMLRDNMVLAAAISEAAANAELSHFVNFGSDAIYSDSTGPLSEYSITAPETLHGVMHFAREAVFRNTIAVPTAFVRSTLIYGARDPHNGYGPNRFRRLAAEGRPITLFGNGEERRDHICIDDVAELVRLIVRHRSEGIVNAATGRVASFREIAELVVRLSGKSVPIVSTPRVGPMPHNGYRPFDPAALLAAFPGFKITSLEDGLAQAQRAQGAAP